MHLVPRYRQKLAHVPVRPGPPGVGRRPALQRPLPRAPQRPARARLRRAAAQPRRAPVRPAAGPHQAAVGAQPRRGARGRPLRDHLEDPPRARRRRQRRRHHLGALRRLARRQRRRRPRAREWVPRPEPTDAELLGRRRCSSARRCRPRAPAGCAPLTRAPRQALGQARRVARRRRRDGVGRAQPGAALALQRADRPAPALHVGRLRGRALQGDQERPRRHAQRRRAVGRRAGARALPAPPRRSRPTGSCSRRWSRCRCAPTTQRGALGNRVAAMWAPLPVGVDRSRGGAAPRSPRRCAGLKESGQAVGAAGADLAGRLRAADDHVARPRGCRRASASSTSSSPTSPGRRSRSTCSGAGCSASTPSCRSPTTRRSASRS